MWVVTVASSGEGQGAGQGDRGGWVDISGCCTPLRGFQDKTVLGSPTGPKPHGWLGGSSEGAASDTLVMSVVVVGGWGHP